VAAREHSSLAIVAIGEDGAADYDFRVEGTADWQWHDGELSKALARRSPSTPDHSR
jgi:fructokinase